LVNLLEEVKSGKKELLELRQLLAYGESYLTSPVINVCED
jgi:ribosomal protein L29